MRQSHGAIDGRPAPSFSLIRLLVAFLLFALAATAPASADDPEGTDCVVAQDGILVCPEMEVEGQLRQPPHVVMGRESLDPPVGDLRASFLTEIEASVAVEPF